MTKTQTNIDTALRLLDENPQGLHYAELIRKIEASIPGMSRNTISGSIWDLDQTHPAFTIQTRPMRSLPTCLTRTST